MSPCVGNLILAREEKEEPSLNSALYRSLREISMENWLIIALFAIVVVQTTALNLAICQKAGLIRGQSSRRSPGSSWSLFASKVDDKSQNSGMELLSVIIPVQDDPGAYLSLIRGKVSQERILKWYVSRIEANMAIIEIVAFSRE
jgi:hypothetical protein